MPTKKKDAKKKARIQKSGKRLVKAATRQSKKSDRNFSASGGRKYAKKVTSAQTASAFEKEGRDRMTTGKKHAKKKDLKVTPRSARKQKEEQEKRYNTRKKKR